MSDVVTMEAMSMPAVSSYLRVLRGATGLSQEEAAVRSGISSKTLGRWEKPTNTYEPGISNLRRLVQVLGGSARDALQLLIQEGATEEDGRIAAKKWLELTADEREQAGSILGNLILSGQITWEQGYKAGRSMGAQLPDDQLEEALAVFKRLKANPGAFQRWLGYADRLLDESDDD